MPTVDNDSVSIHYAVDGAGAPPLVFVHGWCCDTRYFQPQFDHFKGGHQVVSIDLRCHGKSGPGPISIEAFADDVAAVCTAVGLEQPIVVGHSMGGTIALEAARRHPGLASGLVLVDPAPLEITPELGAVLGQLLEGLSGPESAKARRGVLDESPVFFLPTDDPDTRAWITDAMCAAPDDVALTGMQSIAAWAGANASTTWDLPILAITAASGLNTPEGLARRGPHIRVEQTPEVGHFNQLLAANRVNQMISEFASQVAHAP